MDTKPEHPKNWTFVPPERIYFNSESLVNGSRQNPDDVEYIREDLFDLETLRLANYQLDVKELETYLETLSFNCHCPHSNIFSSPEYDHHHSSWCPTRIKDRLQQIFRLGPYAPVHIGAKI